MARSVPGAASQKSAAGRSAGYAGGEALVMAPIRQLQWVQGALGVLTVAVEHAASPEFSNEGAALLLRMLRQESARALESLAPTGFTP